MTEEQITIEIWSLIPEADIKKACRKCSCKLISTERMERSNSNYFTISSKEMANFFYLGKEIHKLYCAL